MTRFSLMARPKSGEPRAAPAIRNASFLEGRGYFEWDERRPHPSRLPAAAAPRLRRAIGGLPETRALATVAHAAVDFAAPDLAGDVDRVRRAVAQMLELGGDLAWMGAILADRLDALPDARLERRNAALLELAAYFPDGSGRARASSMASSLSRYEAGRWRQDRAYATAPPHYGEEDRALFTVLKASDARGAPREKTIRDALAAARGVGKTFAVPLAHDSADLIPEQPRSGVLTCPPLSRKKSKCSPCSRANPTTPNSSSRTERRKWRGAASC